MDWLTPTTGLLAAAAAVPLLVALYFLRLRRTLLPISSTLLWRRAVQDLQVNAPFQRLRRNLLLLLQLLAIGCLLAALAGPIVRLDTRPAVRYVLLIDRSASMNATDGESGSTRLDQARRQARKVIESMRSSQRFRLTAGDAGGGDQAMVIAFDEHAKVACSFTSDRQKLLDAIDAIEPSDGPSELAEALSLARAFSKSSGQADSPAGGRDSAKIELFSDGKLADLGELSDAGGAVTFHAVGQSDDNVGIVAMQARRSYDRPEQVDVFVSLANYSAQLADCDVELTADGNIRDVRTVTVPPRGPGQGSQGGPPGQVGITFSMTHSGSGLVTVRQLRRDKLPGDDVAWAVLPPPRRLSVLLVTGGNPALAAALRSCPVANFSQSTPAEYDAILASTRTSQPIDLVVFDGVVPAGELPPGRYLTFGRPPSQLGLTAVASTELRPIVDWQANHPLLQHVAMDRVVTQKWHRLTAESAGGRFPGQVLARFADGPAIVLARRNNSAFLVVAFDVMESNWPFDAGFAMFCYNVAAFLGSEMSQADQTALPVGGVITVPAGASDAVPAMLSGPDGLKVELAVQLGAVYRFAETRRAGIYTVAPPGSAEQRFAVNLLDAGESDISPAGEIHLAGQTIVAVGEPVRANQELWPWLALAALALVCAEWLVYNSRVRL